MKQKKIKQQFYVLNYLCFQFNGGNSLKCSHKSLVLLKLLGQIVATYMSKYGIVMENKTYFQIQ